MGIGAKRPVILGVFSAAVVISLVSSAAPVTPINPTPPAPTVVGTAPLPPAPLADLVVTDISVDAECGVVAHLANAGGAAVPATVAEFLLTFSGVVKGQWRVSAEKLRAPGSTMTYSLPLPKVVGSQTQKVILTSNGFVEASNTNNSRTETVTCSPKFADVALTVTTKPDCSRTIEVSNIGDGGIHPQAWNLQITRMIDGLIHTPLPLQVVDPSHALAMPGGKAVYNEPLTGMRAYEKATYSLSYPYQEKGNNKANNTVTVTVPQTCRGTRPPMDVAITNVRLDGSCRLIATAKNVGTNPLPFLSLSTTFLKNGVNAGSWAADLTRASAPGAETTIYGPFATETTPTQVKVVIDSANHVAELREDNNTATSVVRCGSTTGSTSLPLRR